MSEIVLTLTLLFNRKRIEEVQCITVSTYTGSTSTTSQEKLVESLTETERLLSKSFKRVVTGGKGSKPVAELFSKKVQQFMDLLLKVRTECVAASKEHLFANPNTEHSCLSGFHVLKSLGVSNWTRCLLPPD